MWFYVIGGIIKPHEICTIFLELEYDTEKIHNINFNNVHCLPRSLKLLIGPHK